MGGGGENKGTAAVGAPPPLQLSGVGKFPQRKTPDNGDPFTFIIALFLLNAVFCLQN